ncbi:hypothetical protein D3C81_1941910 [compost metagenome]
MENGETRWLGKALLVRRRERVPRVVPVRLSGAGNAGLSAGGPVPYGCGINGRRFIRDGLERKVLSQ